jgi:carbamoyltransferase
MTMKSAGRVPIVCALAQALEAFWTFPLDALVLGPFLLEKEGSR